MKYMISRSGNDFSAARYPNCPIFGVGRIVPEAVRRFVNTLGLQLQEPFRLPPLQPSLPLGTPYLSTQKGLFLVVRWRSGCPFPVSRKMRFQQVKCYREVGKTGTILDEAELLGRCDSLMRQHEGK